MMHTSENSNGEGGGAIYADEVGAFTLSEVVTMSLVFSLVSENLPNN